MCGRTKAQALCANVLAPYSVAYKYIQITSKQTICPFQWQPVHQTKVRPIVLRYLYFEEGVQHALLDFYSDSNDTSEAITNQLLAKLEMSGLDVKYMSAYAFIQIHLDVKCMSAYACIQINLSVYYLLFM